MLCFIVVPHFAPFKKGWPFPCLGRQKNIGQNLVLDLQKSSWTSPRMSGSQKKMQLKQSNQNKQLVLGAAAHRQSYRVTQPFPI